MKPLDAILARCEEGDRNAAAAMCEALDEPERSYGLGLVAIRRGYPDSAQVLISRALQSRDEPHWRANLASALLAQKKYTEAIQEFRTALEANSEMGVAQNQFSLALLEARDFAGAVQAAKAAVRLMPTNPAAYDNLGIAWYYYGRPRDAYIAHSAALELDPARRQSRKNRGLSALMAGTLERGWPGYEERDAAQQKPEFPPRWQGEALDGQPLLLHAEQGMGDGIQFCRYVPLAAKRANAPIWLQAPRRMHRLYQGLEGVSRLVEENVGAHRWAPLMSMPLLLGPREVDIPDKVPYLSAEPDRVDQWIDRVPIGWLRVGVCWQGNPRSVAERGRSFSLRELAPVSTVPGVQLISLQRHHGLDQLGSLPGVRILEGLDEGPDAFVDTAAVMMSLDLVITADTAIAHLAGALGRRVWVALRSVPDWRWQFRRTDSPWYPTMRLFRQQTWGEWKPVFQEMREALFEWEE